MIQHKGMLRGKLNFAIAALLITVAGAIAALAIIETSLEADDAGYAGAGAASEEAPSLEEALEGTR